MSTFTPTLGISKAELFAPFFLRAVNRLLLLALALFLITGCTGLKEANQAVTTPSAAVAETALNDAFSGNQFHQATSIGNVP